MNRSEYRRIVSAIEEVPTLPAVAIRVSEIAGDENRFSFSNVSKIIEMDPSLAARILKFANSPLYARGEDITTLQRATSFLGANMIRNLALSAAVFNIFGSDKGEVNGFSVPDFWRHSTASALVARTLALRLHFRDPDEAFLAGLLHDIGKIAMYHCLPNEMAEVMRTMQGTRETMSKVEQEVLGTDHTEIGKWVAQHWNLPKRVVEPIWLHHQPLSGRSHDELSNPAFLAQFADAIVNLYHIGSSGNDRLSPPLDPYLRATGMKLGEVEQLVQSTFEQMENLSEMLGLEESTSDVYMSAVRRANTELGRISFELEARCRALDVSEKTLKNLCDFVAKIKPEDDIRTVLTQIIKAAHRAFNAKKVICLAFNEEEEYLIGKRLDSEMEIISEINLPMQDEIFMPKADSGGQADTVSLLERSLLSDPDGGQIYSEIIRALQSSSLIVNPLRSGKRLIGELLLDVGHLQEEARRHLEIFTSLVASALDRCMMHENLQHSIEDLARASRKVEESQVQLFQFERLASVGRLAAGAAHEINNPLAVISGKAQMLAWNKDEKKRQVDIKIIIDQTRRISRIINDLMGFARPTQPELSSTNLSDVIAHALSLVQNQINLDNIKVVRNFVDDLPKTVADPHQLEQVFLNLLINASHAMPDGGAITLGLGLGDDPRFLECKFQDSGEGISEENLRHIFDPFFTTKEEGKGTGLGLAICHNIIDNHGGQIEVESKKGVGTVFTILLPVDQGAQIRAIQSDMKKTNRRKPRPNGKKKHRLLVVDDEADLRDVLTHSLTHAGYDVQTASDGVEGLEYLANNEVDAVLLDIRMPKKDGLEVLSAIRTNLSQVPVIIITGLATSEQITQALDHGAHVVIHKPFDIDEVISNVDEAIKKAKSLAKGGGAA
jgi:putative nucleotidyltransferase with HDIG domain